MGRVAVGEDEGLQEARPRLRTSDAPAARRRRYGGTQAAATTAAPGGDDPARGLLPPPAPSIFARMDRRAGVPRGVDHLIYAVPDLGRGVEEIEGLLGVRPEPGGRHPEYGTRNALLSLGPETYLEVMAPDPGLERPERGRLFGLDTTEEPWLATWVLRSEAIEVDAARARARGVPLGPVRAGARERPDGTTVSWRLTDPYATPRDGVVPFLIAWSETPHPAGSAPPAGALVSLRAEHPQPEAVREALEALGVEMRVEPGPRARLVATVATDRGRVEVG